MVSDIPLDDATDVELAAAVHENMYALFRAMSGLPGGEVEETATLCRHIAFPTNPMYKGVWRTRLTEDSLDDAITETIAWFRSRHAPFFFWWTGTGTTPHGLEKRLMAHGLMSMEEQTAELAPGIISTAIGSPGMIADLRQMNEAALMQVPEGFVIQEVRDEKSLLDFKRVLVAGYEIPERMADGWVQAAQRVGIGNTPWRMYLGRLNGEPVATNMVLNGAGVSGVYGVATIPSARGKGIGGAITLKPLLDAREAGYHYAVLYASEMGIRAYERIGFRQCDVRVNRFLWREGHGSL